MKLRIVTPLNVNRCAWDVSWLLRSRITARFQRRQAGRPHRVRRPGASTASGFGTQAFVNNDSGEITGFYTDTNVVPHGFIRAADGKITTFDAPGAGLGAGLDQGTEAISINKRGEIAGQFADSNNVYHAFIRSPESIFTTFEVPGAGTRAFQGTEAFSNNANGETAGIYIDGSNVQHGFVRSREGKIKTFDPPDAVGYTMVCEETCLNGDGVATGFYLDVKQRFARLLAQAGWEDHGVQRAGRATGHSQCEY